VNYCEADGIDMKLMEGTIEQLYKEKVISNDIPEPEIIKKVKVLRSTSAYEMIMSASSQDEAIECTEEWLEQSSREQKWSTQNNDVLRVMTYNVGGLGSNNEKESKLLARIDKFKIDIAIILDTRVEAKNVCFFRKKLMRKHPGYTVWGTSPKIKGKNAKIGGTMVLLSDRIKSHHITEEMQYGSLVKIVCYFGGIRLNVMGVYWPSPNPEEGSLWSALQEAYPETDPYTRLKETLRNYVDLAVESNEILIVGGDVNEDPNRHQSDRLDLHPLINSSTES
jgi:exonuclease III